MFADVLGGAAFLFAQPAALLVLVLLVIGLRDTAARPALLAAGLAAVGAIVPLWVDPGWPNWVVSAWVALAALALAVGWQPHRAVADTFGAIGGLLLGHAAGVPTATGAEAFGAVGAAVLVVVAAWALWRAVAGRLPAVVSRLAPRIAAAWLAAIASLLLALQLAGR
jgi:hypothetical protein